MRIILITLCTLFTFSFASDQTVKVTEVHEITKPFTTKIKVGEHCYEDTIEVDVRCGESKDTNSIGIDTLLGATIGVVIGNQMGKGSGRDAAKILGGLGGGYIANQHRNSAQGNCKSYESVTKCFPKYEYKTEYKTVGFNNCAMIDGVKYCKQTKEPIEYLKVKRTVTVY